MKEGLTKNDLVRFKARLVAKSFTLIEGVDYNEIFSPKYITIRVILLLVTQFNWELDQTDVKKALLDVDLEEVIYMRQLECF